MSGDEAQAAVAALAPAGTTEADDLTSFVERGDLDRLGAALASRGLGAAARPALHTAASLDAVEAARMLVARGAAIEAESAEATALQRALPPAVSPSLYSCL